MESTCPRSRRGDDSFRSPRIAPLLEYGRPAAPARRWGFDLVALVPAIPAALSPFLNFVYDYSPLGVIASAIRDWPQNRPLDMSGFPGLISVAAPFLLGTLFLLCQLRLLIRPGLTKIEIWTIWIFAAGLACFVIAFLGFALLEDGMNVFNEFGYPGVVLPPSLLLAGAGGLYYRRSAIDPSRLAHLSTAVVYVAGVSLPLSALPDSSELGWKLTLVAAIGLTFIFVCHVFRRK
jgi:hypothetical protein